MAKQINALQAQVKQLNNRIAGMKSGSIPLSKVSRPHEREPGLKSAYADLKDDVVADYIYGLYHPDVVFNEHLDIKSPSRLSIPTTSFHFKDTMTIAPNNSGNFCVIWNPNFLGTSSMLIERHAPENVTEANYKGYFSNLYFNNDDALSGNGSMTGSWNCQSFKHIRQDFGKYRLTSACIKVKYTGKVLDQSGCLSACASYFTFPRTCHISPRSDADIANYPFLYSDLNLGKFGDFDNIRQGQWSHTVNIVSEPDGITCVYLPTDPLSEVFVRNGETIDSESEETTWQSTSVQCKWLPKNATLSYAICGYGIDSTASCITVETYYNFEIIVQDDQIPYFRPHVSDARLVRYSDRISRLVQSVNGTFGGVTLSKTHNDSSVMSRIKGALSNAYKYAGDIVPLVMKLGKAIL